MIKVKHLEKYSWIVIRTSGEDSRMRKSWPIFPRLGTQTASSWMDLAQLERVLVESLSRILCHYLLADNGTPPSLLA